MPPHKLIRKPRYDSSFAARKFCNFIYSNRHVGYGAAIREKFCQYLAEYKKVDCPGAALNNMKDAISPRYGDWIQGKIDFIKNYKFTIAFENAYDAGYITEKITHPLLAGSLPIYKGAPDVAINFNKESFINADNFKNFEELVEYIDYLDNNEVEYLRKLNASVFSDNFDAEGFSQKFEEFIVNIIENGHRIVHYINQIQTPPAFTYSRFTKCVTESIIQPLLDNNSEKSEQLIRDCMGIKGAHKYNRKDMMLEFLKPLNQKINFMTALAEQMDKYEEIFQKTDPAFMHKLELIRALARLSGTMGNENIIWRNDSSIREMVAKLLSILWPYEVENINKAVVEQGGRYIIMDEPKSGDMVIYIDDPGNTQDVHIFTDLGCKVFIFGSESGETQKKIATISLDYKSESIIDDIQRELETVINSCTKDQNIHLLLSTNKHGKDLLKIMHPRLLRQIHQIHLRISDICDSQSIIEKIQNVSRLLDTHFPMHLRLDENTKVNVFNNFLITDNIEISFILKHVQSAPRYSGIIPMETNLNASDKQIYAGKIDYIIN